ncbi:transcriptional regulator [Acidithiobacillus ferrivorans]|uniref:Transcriptional regulator n=1 Tax=Acidithiobacillus ferrivorans TaxID=160808 RepID=A0A1B9BZE5_9PROT|nr:transcriptional regulator [Acidithiobacillus ferrivorans]OCB03087.1 transcriptional regulator [Acidithiobacillus ferrivorans]
MNTQISEAIIHWPHVAPLLQPAHTEEEYKALVEALDAVLDAGGADESHPMARLADYLGDLVAEWEARDPMPEGAPPLEVLRFLMAQYGLKQVDLTEIGSQGVVSEVLHGKRNLNLRQARALAERFGVSAQMFL